jgi:hypothetical protein
MSSDQALPTGHIPPPFSASDARPNER